MTKQGRTGRHAGKTRQHDESTSCFLRRLYVSGHTEQHRHDRGDQEPVPPQQALDIRSSSLFVAHRVRALGSLSRQEGEDLTTPREGKKKKKESKKKKRALAGKKDVQVRTTQRRRWRGRVATAKGCCRQTLPMAGDGVKEGGSVCLCH